MGFRYRGDGYLFRGMSSGLGAAIVSDLFGFYEDAGPLCNLERELGVYLFSHELSDAFSVSRLWQTGVDNAVLVFHSEHFDSAWRNRRAAFLGFAEPGVVFKYPFLVEPLQWEQLAYVIVHPATHARLEQLLQDDKPSEEQKSLRRALKRYREMGIYRKIVAPSLPATEGVERKEMEDALNDLLASRHIAAAQPVPADNFPGQA